MYLVTGVYHLKSMKVEACQSPYLQRSNILRFSFPINLRTCISEGLGRLLSSNRQTPFSTRGRNPRFLLGRPIRPRSLLEEKQLVGSTDGVVHPQRLNTKTSTVLILQYQILWILVIHTVIWSHESPSFCQHTVRATSML